MVTKEMISKPYYKLKNIMDMQGYSQEKMAQVIKMPYTTFNLKINRKNGRDFKVSEAAKIAEELNINIGDFY